MLDSLYGERVVINSRQYFYIQDSLKSLGDTALTGELRREYEKYCRDFRRLTRLPTSGQEVWAAPCP
jgi:hypothetical protein